MASSYLSSSLVALLILLQFMTNIASGHSQLAPRTNTEYIKNSCVATTYPRLCYHSLSIYASKIKTDPKVLASTALNITLKATKSTSKMMIKISKIPGSLSKEAAAAMADCIELVSDSLDELQQSIDELGHIRNSNFWLTMSDIQTWVSASLTDEDTCLDGLQGKAMNPNAKTIVRGHIVKVAHLTSVALALINSYASSNPVSP